MDNKFIFTLMIFCHFIGDFTLQKEWISMAKSKSYWKAIDRCKNDYIPVLINHSICWTFMIMLPIAISYNYKPPAAFYILFIMNTLIHTFIDNLKASKNIINLIVDQLLHFIQILISFITLVSWIY